MNANDKRAVVLIVDDEASNIEVLSAALEDEYEVCFATSGAEALEVARSVTPDLVLLDVLMPGIDGYETCRQIKEDPILADIPVIFTTALGDREAEARGLQAGAIDYVTKPISAIVVRARVRNHLQTKRLRDQLAEMAVTDALTGLGNRRRMERALNQEVVRLARSGAQLSIVILDIDFFKRFNDHYGHTAGDRCIAMVAAALNRAVRRAADLAIRYGGEEFACLLPEAGHGEAMEVARNIQERVRALGIPHGHSEAAPYVTVSVGVATAACFAGADPMSWIRAADEQLYLAKAAGRNKVVGRIFEERELRALMVA